MKAILCVAAIIYLVALTRVQNIYYSNSYALFTRAGEITEDNFVACNNIGDALISLNRMDEAGSYFAKAMALNPKYDDAIYNYALYLAKKGDPLNAAAHFSRVIKINPHYIAAYINLAIIQYHRGNIGEAETLLLKALELDPDDGNAHNNLGIIRADQGKLEEAIRHYLLAIKNKPALIQARVNLSEAYEKAGHYTQAIAAYKALSRMMPDNQANTPIESPACMRGKANSGNVKVRSKSPYSMGLISLSPWSRTKNSLTSGKQPIMRICWRR